MTWANVIAAGVLVCGGVYVVERLAPAPTRPQVEIRERTIIQERTLPPIVTKLQTILTQYVTNKDAVATLSNAIVDYDRYRTLPGWVAISNDRIHAGLVARAWSVEYVVRERNNIAGALAGSMFGGVYLRRIGNAWVGAIAGAGDGRAQVAGVAAWSW